MSSDHTRPTPYSRDEIRAQSGLEAAEFDARAIRDLSVPQSVLMENAGRSAALVIQALHLPRRLVGMVGAGNNGGDALVVLRTMAAWGVDVMALLVADRVRTIRCFTVGPSVPYPTPISRMTSVIGCSMTRMSSSTVS